MRDINLILEDSKKIINTLIEFDKSEMGGVGSLNILKKEYETPKRVLNVLIKKGILLKEGRFLKRTYKINEKSKELVYIKERYLIDKLENLKRALSGKVKKLMVLDKNFELVKDFLVNVLIVTDKTEDEVRSILNNIDMEAINTRYIVMNEDEFDKAYRDSSNIYKRVKNGIVLYENEKT